MIHVRARHPDAPGPNAFKNANAIRARGGAQLRIPPGIIDHDRAAGGHALLRRREADWPLVERPILAIHHDQVPRRAVADGRHVVRRCEIARVFEVERAVADGGVRTPPIRPAAPAAISSTPGYPRPTPLPRRARKRTASNRRCRIQKPASWGATSPPAIPSPRS